MTSGGPSHVSRGGERSRGVGGGMGDQKKFRAITPFIYYRITILTNAAPQDTLGVFFYIVKELILLNGSPHFGFKRPGGPFVKKSALRAGGPRGKRHNATVASPPLRMTVKCFKNFIFSSQYWKWR